MSKMRLKHFYFMDNDETIIRIAAKRKPSESTAGISGSWVVNEYHSEPLLPKRFYMPCFPEITWNKLSEMIYVGSTKIDEGNENE